MKGVYLPASIVLSALATSYAFLSAPVNLRSTSGFDLMKQLPSTTVRTNPIAGWFGGGANDAEKEEQFRLQQEILERRRNPSKNEAYFAKVEKERKEREEEIKRKQLPTRGEDPIIKWNKLRKEETIKDLDYADEPKGGIPLPMASFGVPKFDNGERFDLRLPYVDTGYVDKSADVIGNFFEKFGGKKKDEDSADDDIKAPTGAEAATVGKAKATGKPKKRSGWWETPAEDEPEPEPALVEEPKKQKGWFGL